MAGLPELNKLGNEPMTLILWRFRLTIVAVERQQCLMCIVRTHVISNNLKMFMTNLFRRQR